MSAFFAIAGVSKRFRGLLAVDRMSAARCAKGEIFAVIGPNGAGKTTLFNMIAGALRPDEGAIAFQGERIDGLRPDEVCRRGIARTFQIVRPFPVLTSKTTSWSARCCAPPTLRAPANRRTR